jgi:hypothetical protein
MINIRKLIDFLDAPPERKSDRTKRIRRYIDAKTQDPPYMALLFVAVLVVWIIFGAIYLNY